jgi:hypothetical protein
MYTSAGKVKNAALFRLYPKRNKQGTVEWLHWSDLPLAAAWAKHALDQLDAFVAKYSGATAHAAQLTGGARAPIIAEAFAVLQSLSSAFQALNVPPIIQFETEKFGTVKLIISFVVLTNGRIQVRTQIAISNQHQRAMVQELQALWDSLGERPLAHDEGVVIDVRTRQKVFRGSLKDSIAYQRNAADTERPFFALWGRKPWDLFRDTSDTELVWSAPLVWERDVIRQKLQLTRPIITAIVRDPWSALVAARERVKAHNDAIAREWKAQLPELSSYSDADQVKIIQSSLNALAQARSEAEIERARAAAREGLATGASSVASVLGVISAAAPPAALVLAPAAAVFGALTALAGLFLQVIPREWLATAETSPPPIPLPYMITGDEGVNNRPTHVVSAPPNFKRASLPGSAPTPLDPEPVFAVTTMTASATPVRTALTAARLSPSLTTSTINNSKLIIQRTREQDTQRHSTNELHSTLQSIDRTSASAARPADAPSPSAATVVGIGVALGALIAWKYA